MPNFTGLWTPTQQLQAKTLGVWPTFPGAPTSVTGIPGATATSVIVSFTAPADAGFPASITGYTVTSSPGGFTASGASSPLTVVGLTTGTAYTFTVTATNESGAGPASSASSSVTPAVPPSYVEDVFSTYLYTGNGSANQSINNGIDLANNGGAIWVKRRSGGSGSWSDHWIFDSVRGTSNGIRVNSTTSNFDISSFSFPFSSTGFTVPNYIPFNESTTNYASWTFRKKAKFFDIVTWTGDGINGRAISHALGSVPGCIMVKRTNGASDWVIYHRSLTTPTNNAMAFSNAAQTTAAYFPTAPTSSVFYTNGDGYQVNTSGQTYVAYIFAHDAGGFGLNGTDNVISCGKFTTTGGGSDVTSVNLGWEPQWLLVKRFDGTASGFYDHWSIIDTQRGMAMNSSANLYAELGDVEAVWPSYDSGIPTPTGFNIIPNANPTVTTSASYLYIAIRRGLMKVPTLGTSVFSPVLTTNDAQPVVAGFPVDFFLEAQRSAPFTASYDRLRGSGQRLYTYSTGAEASLGTTGTFASNTSVTPNEFGASSSIIVECFRRAAGFFDEVCYTGFNQFSGSFGYAAQSLTHNLAVTPEFIIVKGRSATGSWFCYLSSMGNGSDLQINSTAAQRTGVVTWNNFTPTSTTFQVNAAAGINTTGSTYVAYLFATCPGVSKVGSYTGNGSTQTINCGFTAGARFILIKRTDATGDWYTYDTARGMTSGTDPYLFLNSTSAEVATAGSVTTVSAGFALNSAVLAAINVSGGTYIFLAIA